MKRRARYDQYDDEDYKDSHSFLSSYRAYRKKSRKQTKYMPTIGHVSDMVVEIMQYLPVKTLVDCTVVCRRWSTLVNDSLLSRAIYRDLIFTPEDWLTYFKLSTGDEAYAKEILPVNIVQLYKSNLFTSRWNHAYRMIWMPRLAMSINTLISLAKEFLPNYPISFWLDILPRHGDSIHQYEGWMTISVKHLSESDHIAFLPHLFEVLATMLCEKAKHGKFNFYEGKYVQCTDTVRGHSILVGHRNYRVCDLSHMNREILDPEESQNRIAVIYNLQNVNPELCTLNYTQ